MANATILLTGATGFIGGATLAHLLETRPDCRLLILARGDDPSVAALRVQQSLGRFVDLKSMAGPLLSCWVVPGDLTDPECLSDERLGAAVRLGEQPAGAAVQSSIRDAPSRDADAASICHGGDPPRLDDVTHVLHLASNTSFRSVRGVRHTNILGTLTLAHRLRRVAGLQRFLFVSTAYLCGDIRNSVVAEDDSPQYGRKHIVEYTNSKAECELLLANTAPELPLVVARPSVVVGHTQFGCLPSASLFWFYRTVDLLRRYTRPLDTREDVVPVDYVARALVFLLFQSDLRHRCYHISAGHGSCVTWHEIVRVFAQCYGDRPENPWKIVDFATIERERDRLRPLLGPGDEDHLLMALRLYFQFSALDVEIFDNSRLLAEGMPAPPKFTDYLQLCATQPPGRSVYDQMRDDE
ncbi:MAG: SDR family oxidoreductase [Planctomycetia bacterium]|nr:SDR family oxidoreductase [Planctomycetia bacterium]